MASRSVADLHPALQGPCIELLRQAAERGIRVMVTCTYRSQEEQKKLYAQGRTAPGNKVTEVLKSRHSAVDAEGRSASEAFDVAVLAHDGKPAWDIKVDVNEDQVPDYRQLGEIGRSLGLEWGGDWKTPDMPHFQLPKVKA